MIDWTLAEPVTGQWGKHMQARLLQTLLIQHCFTHIQYELNPPYNSSSSQWLSRACQCQPGTRPKQTYCTNCFHCKHDLYVAYNNTEHQHNRVIMRRKLLHQHFQCVKLITHLGSWLIARKRLSEDTELASVTRILTGGKLLKWSWMSAVDT